MTIDSLLKFLVVFIFLFAYFCYWGLYLVPIDYIVIQIINLTVCSGSYFLYSFRYVFLSKLAIVLFALTIYRVFQGPVWYDPVETGYTFSLDVGIITFKGSPRGNYVEEWLKRTNLPLPFVDVADPTHDNKNTLECSPLCGCDKAITSKMRYTQRLKTLFLNYTSKSEWFLLLEDDAHPTMYFESRLMSLLPTLSKYDYVSLDVRTLAGIGWHFSFKMCCSVGMLIKVSSIDEIGSQIGIKLEYGCSEEWDFIIGSMCSSKQINCLAIPLLHENNFKSTLS